MLHLGARPGWASSARPRTALAVLLAAVLAMAPGLFRRTAGLRDDLAPAVAEEVP